MPEDLIAVLMLTWWVEQEMRVPTKDLANYLQRLLLPLSEPETAYAI